MEVRGVVIKQDKGAWVAKLYPRGKDSSVFIAEGKKQKDVIAECNAKIEEENWTLMGSYERMD